MRKYFSTKYLNTQPRGLFQQGLHYLVTASPRRESAIIQAPAPDDFKFPNEESLKVKQQIHLAGVEPLVGNSSSGCQPVCARQATYPPIVESNACAYRGHCRSSGRILDIGLCPPSFQAEKIPIESQAEFFALEPNCEETFGLKVFCEGSSVYDPFVYISRQVWR